MYLSAREAHSSCNTAIHFWTIFEMKGVTWFLIEFGNNITKLIFFSGNLAWICPWYTLVISVEKERSIVPVVNEHSSLDIDNENCSLIIGTGQVCNHTTNRRTWRRPWSDMRQYEWNYVDWVNSMSLTNGYHIEYKMRINWKDYAWSPLSRVWKEWLLSVLPPSMRYT